MEITNFNISEAGLIEMESYAKIEILDKKSFKIVKQYRSIVRKLRTTIEKRKKELKAPLIEKGKEIESTAKKILSRIKTVEDDLVKKIFIEESRLKEIEQAKIRAEQDRVDKIEIEYKKLLQLINAGKQYGLTSSEIKTAWENLLLKNTITKEVYQEKFEMACEIKKLGIRDIEKYHEETLKLEERQAELLRQEEIAKEKQAELERQKEKVREDLKQKEEKIRQEKEKLKAQQEELKKKEAVLKENARQIDEKIKLEKKEKTIETIIPSEEIKSKAIEHKEKVFTTNNETSKNIPDPEMVKRHNRELLNIYIKQIKALRPPAFIRNKVHNFINELELL